MKAWKLGRAGRIALVSFSSMVVLLLLVIGVGVYLSQSDWLRDRLRERVVSELERATGGRVEIGAVQVDWWNLHAEVSRLIVHGKEPAEQSPLLSIDRLTIGLKVLSFVSRQIDLQTVVVESPKFHLIVYGNGETNLPKPKLPRATRKSVPEAVLDLKAGLFDLRHGLADIDFAGRRWQKLPLDVKAQNFVSHVTYEALRSRYAGLVSASPIRFAGRDFSLFVNAGFEKNRVTVENASLASRHSRVDFTSGALNEFADPVLTGEVKAIASVEELGELLRWPTHQGGTAHIAGKARFKNLRDFEVRGTVHGDGVRFQTPSNSFAIRNARVDSNYIVKPEHVKLDRIRVAVLGGSVEGSGEIRDWRKFSSKGRVKAISLRKGAATFTRYSLPYDALAQADYEVSGNFERIENTVVSALATLSPAPDSEPVTGSAELRYDGPTNTLLFGNSRVDLPRTHVEASGTLNGHLDVHAVSSHPEDALPFFNLKQFPATLKNGTGEFRGTVDGSLLSPLIVGHAAVTNVEYQGEVIDAISGDLRLRDSAVAVSNGRVTHQGFVGQVDGSLGLSDWKLSDAGAVSARARLQQADLTRALVILKQKDVPLRGLVDGTANISGTVGNPAVTADLRATHGDIGGEPYDLLNAHIESPSAGVQTAAGEVVAGAKRVTVQARYSHASDQFLPGTLSFHLASNRAALAQFAVLHKEQPSLTGFGTLKADGAIAFSNDGKAVQYRFSKLDGDLDLQSVELAGRPLGEAKVTAVTKDDVMTAHIASNLAQTVTTGTATVRLNGDYPLDGNVTFQKLDLSTLWKLASSQSFPVNFEGNAAGSLQLHGPLRKPELLTGSLEIPTLSVRALPSTGPAAATIESFVLKNAGPLRATLAKNAIRMDAVRFDAPNTNLSVTGSIGLAQNAPLDLRAQGKVNLQILDGFSQDLRSQGALSLNATLRGTITNPDFSGRAELTDGDFHFVDFSSGLTNAKGSLLFNGSRATIQSLSAESGGGTVDTTGFLAFSKGVLAFNLEARVRQVRVRYPEGVSTVADANLTVAGTSQRSLASGQVRIRRLTINPRSGATGVIAKSVEPIRTPSASSGLLANLNLDVQVETTPDVAVQTSLAQTLQGEANLRLRGTAVSPSLIGRVTVTEGEIVFFGNKYTVTQGTISFFNPARIEPILNVDLETKARGVQIIITVSGPLDKPLNVTYRSDPPLQFADILALLATGRSPTDPSLALRDTTANQSLQQLGASALLGQAIANPVSGRLQRFFGVSKLKIDPQLSGITGSPQARLTVEQQVTPDVLFTYITDVSSTSTQLIRVEWALNKTWSAILTREENGYVGLDFAYKKRFK